MPCLKMKMKNVLVLLVLVACLLCADLHAFASPQRVQRRPTQSGAAASDNNDNLDSLRQALEMAWNAEIMGQVPSSPQSAAQEAAVAVQNAWNQQLGLVMVDILLPQYDASQSDKLYDPLLAVEFCIALAQTLDTKTSIIVRDNKTIQTVSRILDKREESMAEIEPKAEEDEETEDEDNAIKPSPADPSDIYSVIDTPKENVGSFRAKLSAEWNKESSTFQDEVNEPKEPIPEKSPQSPSKAKKAVKSKKMYRLCSMLGDALGMQKGADMQRAVIAAVQANALPQQNEETVIILSAASPQELIGIRALVAKYESTRKIILVNCCTTPLPRELLRAQTVYSILPLIAKPSNKLDPSPRDNKPQLPLVKPKIVVLRRFPRDWQVFVDTGTGFRMADRAPASGVKQKGPSLSWVVNAVERYLKTQVR